MGADADSLGYSERRFRQSRRGRYLDGFERRIVTRVLSQLPPGSHVVDVPCGDGRMTDLILSLGHKVTSIDLVRQGRWANPAEPLPMITGSIFEMPLAAGAADLCLTVRLLHWFTMDEIDRALREIHRVAPRALVTFYNRNSLRILRKRLYGHDHKHAKSYSYGEVCAAARRNGFRVVAHYPMLSFFFQNQFLYLEHAD